MHSFKKSICKTCQISKTIPCTWPQFLWSLWASVFSPIFQLSKLLLPEAELPKVIKVVRIRAGISPPWAEQSKSAHLLWGRPRLATSPRACCSSKKPQSLGQAFCSSFWLRQTIPFISWGGDFWNNSSSLTQSYLHEAVFTASLIKSISYSGPAALQKKQKTKKKMCLQKPHIWQLNDSGPKQTDLTHPTNCDGCERSTGYQSWKAPLKSWKLQYKSLILWMGTLNLSLKKGQPNVKQRQSQGQNDLLTQNLMPFQLNTGDLNITRWNSIMMWAGNWKNNHQPYSSLPYRDMQISKLFHGPYLISFSQQCHGAVFVSLQQ